MKMQMMTMLVVKLLLATRLVVFCEGKNIEFLHARNESELGSSQMLFNSKSHIDKFADSWRYYAKANDIAKREKLRMALRDALHSIERPEKHSVVSSNANPVERVKKAVGLLKEFKRMYTLSDAVKRTLIAYEKAKKKLTSRGITTIRDHVMPEMTKDTSSDKKDIIPIYKHASIEVPEQNLREPIILRRTSKISVKANPLTNGDFGIEYASIDPKYSNIQQAEKVVRAAKIIVTYSGGRKKGTNSDSLDGRDKDSDIKEYAHRKSIFPFPRRHGVASGEKGLSKIIRDKSGDADDTTPGESRSAVSSLIESLTNGEDELPAEDKAAIESLGSNRLVSFSEKTRISARSKKQVVNQYVGQLKKLYGRYLKIKEENDTVENALQFQNEIINSNLGNVSRDMLGNLTFMSTKELVDNAVHKSKEDEEKAEMAEDVKPVIKSIDDDSATSNKQEDTLRELKEARQAKVRYEIAKQDLAHKIKELYILANNYEKDETENQILEVKNLISHTPQGKDVIIPGAHEAHRAPTPALEQRANNITERDETHPGLGLSVISHRGIAKSSISSGEEDKGSSMEAVEIAEDEKEESGSSETKKESGSGDTKTKATKKTQYDYLQLPLKHKAAKKEESGKNDDETLNIIAQALKEDMKAVEKSENKDQGDNSDSKGDNKADAKDTKGEDTSASQENKTPLESTPDVHNDTNVKALEKDKDDGDNKDNKDDVDKDNKGEDTTSKKLKDAENKDKGSEVHNSTRVTDEKHKEVNILNDGKDDLESKHALPQHYNESVDEYLTKALQEIITADASANNNNNQATQIPTVTGNSELAPDPAAASWPEENDIDDNNVNPTEHNKNVVENAMKQHARNPNLPLPLVDTKGDKIKLNPAINASVVDTGGGGGEAQVQATPAPTTTQATTTPENAFPQVSALAPEPAHESMQPVAATKPEPKPMQQPTAVLLHATQKNVSTALPDIDLHDPDNKQLLDKASHMEESIAAAQDKLYSDAEVKLGVSDIETHNKGVSTGETSTKESDKDHKEEPYSRNTMETTQDVKPVTTSFAPSTSQSFPYYAHNKIDPYGSINEKVKGVERITDVERVDDPGIEDGVGGSLDNAHCKDTIASPNNLLTPLSTDESKPIAFIPPAEKSWVKPNFPDTPDTFQSNSQINTGDVATVPQGQSTSDPFRMPAILNHGATPDVAMANQAFQNQQDLAGLPPEFVTRPKTTQDGMQFSQGVSSPSYAQNPAHDHSQRQHPAGNGGSNIEPWPKSQSVDPSMTKPRQQMMDEPENGEGGDEENSLENHVRPPTSYDHQIADQPMFTDRMDDTENNLSPSGEEKAAKIQEMEDRKFQYASPFNNDEASRLNFKMNMLKKMNPVNSLKKLAEAITENEQLARESKLDGLTKQAQGRHKAEEEEEPVRSHHHRRHHRHHHHHHRRHHHDDDIEEPEEPIGADPEEEDEEEDAPDDGEDDDDDDDDEDKDKKSKIKYVDGKTDKHSTAKYNSTVNGGLDESVHIDELEDNKRSGIPTYDKKKKSKVPKGIEKKGNYKRYPASEKTNEEKKWTTRKKTTKAITTTVKH